MHKVRGNYSSCTGRSSENICSNSGGAQEKGKRGSKQDGAVKIYVATVEALRKKERGVQNRMKLSLPKKKQNLVHFCISPSVEC
jgi:hypothetical protein